MKKQQFKALKSCLLNVINVELNCMEMSNVFIFLKWYENTYMCKPTVSGKTSWSSERFFFFLAAVSPWPADVHSAPQSSRVFPVLFLKPNTDFRTRTRGLVLIVFGRTQRWKRIARVLTLHSFLKTPSGGCGCAETGRPSASVRTAGSCARAAF